MAAEQGDTIAQYDVATLQLRGEGGVQQNFMEAFKWLTLARSGTKDARIPLMADQGLRYLTARMTQDQIDRAHSFAQRWRPQPGLTIRLSNAP